VAPAGSYDADAFVYLDNVEWNYQNANLAPGGQGYETLLHELGHALGLKHPFDDSITCRHRRTTRRTP
jgi:serralysin